MKELKKHLEEFEIIRRACSGEEGEIDRWMILRAVQNWTLSGHRRLKEIDAAVREAKAALSERTDCRVGLRPPRNDRRGRGLFDVRGAHLRKKVSA